MDAPHNDPSRDLALVRAAVAGQPDAVHRLAERLQCVARVLSRENARLGHPLDAHDLADVTQDAIVVLLRKLSEYRGLGPFEGWAFHVSRFEFFNAVRRRRKLPRGLGEDDGNLLDASVAKELRQLAARETLEAAMARVGGLAEQALRMKHFEGLSIEQMAARAGTSTSGMKARYHRAYLRLEEIITAEADKEDMDGTVS